MKVLMVIDSLSLGGAERVLATLSRVAPDAGFHFDVQVLSLPGSHRSAMEPVLEAAGVPTDYLSIRRLADPRALPRLVRAIRDSDCDVVHAHLEYAATLVPVAARIAGRPCVCTFHHVAVSLSRKEALKERLAVLAANRSAGVVFVSRASLESFARTYGGPRKNWSVVENGVDLEAFTPGPAAMPSELAIPPGVPVVTVVGALRWRKGHHVTLAAWPTVRRSIPDARLLIVGDGPEAGRLREQTSALGLDDSVVFAGMRTDVARLMRASSLLALPSQHEALPTTLMEAAACGRPVIATDVDGIPEVVADGETGTLVPFGDEAAFASAAIALLADEQRLQAMGVSARRLAEERFDAGRWADRLFEVYARAADVARSPAGGRECALR
jgi:glycosyltransferase involved in cell wall biosynthesis